MKYWTCFEWNVSALADLNISTSPVVIRNAKQGDEEVVLKVLLDAFSMDSTWGDINRKIDESMVKFTAAAFDKSNPTPTCVVAQHGQRIIGASVLAGSPDAANHLLSGPMILHEYRNRGLGTALLAASLEFLRERGFEKVRGITRDKSTAAQFIYRKFGGGQVPCSQNPL
jgi:GNAT superfamily N-acetyltransferase